MMINLKYLNQIEGQLLCIIGSKKFFNFRTSLGLELAMVNVLAQFCFGQIKEKGTL